MVQTTSDELDTLLKGVFSGVKQVATWVKLSRFGVIAALTPELPIPNNPLGHFVNVRTVIAPSKHGFEFSALRSGQWKSHHPSSSRPYYLA